MNSCNGSQCNAVYRRIKKCSINFHLRAQEIILFCLYDVGFLSFTSLNKFSRVELWKEKRHSRQNENVFNLPPITMLGTSTAAGNFSEEGKTCVIFRSVLFALFSWVA